MSATYHGWLFAVFFWTGLSVGSAALLMIHHLTGGRWGFAIRRVLEAALVPFPVMAVLFIPVFFGLEHLYPWAQPGMVVHDEVLQKRQPYMSPAGFVVRTLVVYVALTWIGGRLRRLSLLQEETTSPAPTRALRASSAAGLAVIPLLSLFAYVDWVMSLEKHWYSTVFMILLCVGQTLAALCWGIVVATRLGVVLSDVHLLRQLGNLMLALVLLWTYLMFAQFVIIWLGNLPHEIGWYLDRVRHGWKWVINVVLLLHFAVPFVVLLSRRAKEHTSVLAGLATILLIAHAVFNGWMILPPAHEPGTVLFAMLAFVLVGALWSLSFFRSLRSAPLNVSNDPRWKRHG